MLNQILTFLPILVEGIDSLNASKGMAYIAAGIAMLAAGFTAFGEGLVAMKAMDAIGRQPEAAGKIRTNMIIGQVMCETSAIYAFILALLLASK